MIAWNDLPTIPFNLAGVKITDAQMDQLNLQRHEFHGDWNYSIQPRRPT